jgi:ankyrin repeat protein
LPEMVLIFRRVSKRVNNITISRMTIHPKISYKILEALIMSRKGSQIIEMIKRKDCPFHPNYVIQLSARTCDNWLFTLLFDNAKTLEILPNRVGDIMLYVCRMGNMYMLDKLSNWVQNGLLLTFPNDEPIIQACRSGNIVMFRRLMLMMANEWKKCGHLAFRTAVDYGRTDVVRELLDPQKKYGIIPACDFCSAVFSATIGGNYDILILLLENESVRQCLNWESYLEFLANMVQYLNGNIHPEMIHMIPEILGNINTDDPDSFQEIFTKVLLVIGRFGKLEDADKLLGPWENRLLVGGISLLQIMRGLINAGPFDYVDGLTFPASEMHRYSEYIKYLVSKPWINIGKDGAHIINLLVKCFPIHLLEFMLGLPNKRMSLREITSTMIFDASRNFNKNNADAMTLLLLSDRRMCKKTRMKNALRTVIDTHANIEIVKKILSFPRVIPNDDQNELIRRASRQGNADVVKLLMGYDCVDPSDKEDESLISATRENHLDVVKLLLNDHRVNPSASGNCPLLMAVRHRNSAMVSLLLSHPKIDVEKRANVIFKTAVKIGDLNVMRVLLSDDRLDPTFNKNDLLMFAILRHYKDMVRLLISDPRISSADHDDNAIILASKEGLQEIVEILQEVLSQTQERKRKKRVPPQNFQQDPSHDY